MKISRRPGGQIRLLYILAASHSGSTLLAMLLGSHPELCTVGELKASALGSVDRYRCSCRRPIATCPFWQAVRREMAARGVPFDLASPPTDFGAVSGHYARSLLRPLHRGRLLEALRDAGLAVSPRWRRHLARVQLANATLAAVVCEKLGARGIVDSSKTAVRLKYLLRNPAFDVSVVRLVRDGRAVANTYLNPACYADAADPLLRGGGDGASREAERLPMSRAAREWRRSNEEAALLLRTLPRSRWIAMRYEDLCSDPLAVLRTLFRFAGVDESVTIGAFRSGEHHVIGNGMRLDATSEIQIDNRWIGALSAPDLASFETIAGPLNRRLGYGEARA